MKDDDYDIHIPKPFIYLRSFVNYGKDLIRDSFIDILDKSLSTEIVDMTIKLKFVSIYDTEPELDKEEWAPINLSKRQNEWNTITGWDLHDEVYQQLKDYIKQGNTPRGYYSVILWVHQGYEGFVIAKYQINIENAFWDEEIGCTINIT